MAAAALAGCGAAEAPPPPAAPAPASQPAIDLALVNATPSALELHADGIHVVDAAGALAPIALHVPPYACECACDAAPPCPCDEPRAATRVEAGARHVVRWAGALRRRRLGATGVCHDVVPPPAGRYAIVACDRGERACAIAEIELPRTEPLVVELRPFDERASCERTDRLARAVRLAIGDARLAGVDERHLAGCADTAPTCAGWQVDLPDASADRSRCEARVVPYEQALRVHLFPAPRHGAPVSIETNVGPEAIRSGYHTVVEASDWAEPSDGSLRAAGVSRHVSHTHGGDPARISGAEIAVWNRTPSPIPLSVRRVEWLTSGSCETPSERRAEPPPLGIEPAVLAPGGPTRVAIWFEPQPAYQAHCDRFAVRATLDAGGRSVTVTSEVRVSRREPRDDETSRRERVKRRHADRAPTAQPGAIPADLGWHARRSRPGS
jgi:hypothetical protein